MRHLDAAAYLDAARTCAELLESLENYAERDEATVRLEEEDPERAFEALRAAEHANRPAA